MNAAEPRWSQDDHAAMQRALALAAKGLFTTDPNPRVGCVLVRDGEVVGEGWHERAGGPHAEPRALAMAGEAARGATAYVTLEPCSHHGRTPPCADALVRAGVTRVVHALRDPFPQVSGRGTQRLREAGITVEEGLCAAEARELNPGFLKRMESGRPFVRLKLAMSLDARTALADGSSRWISGEAARTDVQQWRARSSAVLSGVGTVLADDPTLDVRLPGTTRQPLRVILDSRLRTPPQSRLLRAEGPVLLVAAAGAPPEALQAAGAEVLHLPTDAAGRPPLAAVLAELARRAVNELHVEAGPTLAGAWLAAGLVDELLLYVAPTLLGGGARPLAHLPALASLEQRGHWRYTDVRSVGDDLRLTLRPL